MAKVTLHKDDDPAIEAAAKREGTFRYFWRELSWEYRRIVPGKCQNRPEGLLSRIVERRSTYNLRLTPIAIRPDSSSRA